MDAPRAVPGRLQRRVRQTLPDEPDLHQHYRNWRAALRNDSEYRLALHLWQAVQQALTEHVKS